MSEEELGTVTLDFCFNDQKQIELQCMIANARMGYSQAIKIGDQNSADYFAASLCAYVDVLGLASPHDPPTNESDKP